MYGNEASVGRAIKDSGVPRSEVCYSAFEQRPETVVEKKSASKANSRTAGYQSTLSAIDESVRTFGHDYIDLYLVR